MWGSHFWPQPVLASVVISAPTDARDHRLLVALWRLGRNEVLTSFVERTVVVLGVSREMMSTVLLWVVAVVRRFSQSRVASLSLDGTR